MTWTWLAFKMKSPAEDLIKSKPWVVLNCAKLKLISTWAELKLTCLPQFPFLALHHCIHSSAVLLHKAAALCCTSLTHSLLHCIALQPSLCTVLPPFQLSAAPRPSFMGQEWPLGHFPLLVRDPLCVKLSYWLVDNAAQRDQILLAVFMDCMHCSG